MKVKKFIDPFFSQVHEMAKKFDMATIENKRELACFVWGMMTDNINPRLV